MKKVVSTEKVSREKAQKARREIRRRLTRIYAEGLSHESIRPVRLSSGQASLRTGFYELARKDLTAENAVLGTPPQGVPKRTSAESAEK